MFTSYNFANNESTGGLNSLASSSTPFLFEAEFDTVVPFEKNKSESISLLNNSLHLANYPLVIVDSAKFVIVGGYLDGSLRVFKTSSGERMNIVYKHNFTVSCL